MLYRDIFKKLMRQNGVTLDHMASELGLGSQQAVSQRLKFSNNPGMADSQRMLSLLGYEIAFVPKGMVDRNPALSEVAYVPEFPEKPSKEAPMTD